MAKPSTELLRGTLDLLILRTLALEPRHGVSIADRIDQITGGTFRIGPGSLFPALHRLEQQALVSGEWTTTEDARRVKVYRLTTAGQRRLIQEKRHWSRIVLAMTKVLESD